MSELTKWARLGYQEGLRTADTGECPVIPTGISHECRKAWFTWWAFGFSFDGFALGGATGTEQGMVGGESPSQAGGLPHETPAPSQPRTFDGQRYIARNYNRI